MDCTEGHAIDGDSDEFLARLGARHGRARGLRDLILVRESDPVRSFPLDASGVGTLCRAWRNRQNAAQQ